MGSLVALRIEPRTARAVLAPLLVLVAFLLLWQNRVFHELFGLQTFAVPLPDQIAEAFYEDRGLLLEAFRETFVPALLGYVAGNVLGLVLAFGLLALPGGAARRASAVGASFAALPITAIAPIVALWIASALWFKAATVAIVVFPSMLVYAYRGMMSADPQALELMASYRASAWQVFRVLRLPSAVPFIFTALKYTTVLMLVGAVICEIVKSQDGLGFEIHDSLVSFGTARAWAAVALLGLTGIATYLLLLAVERLLFPWALRREAS